MIDHRLHPPAFGFEPAQSDFWLTIHDAGANLLILLVGIHLAMHWPWIRRNVSRIKPSRAAT